MDFVSDALASGRRFRTLNIADDFSREAPAIEVDTSLGGVRVARVLDRLKIERGLPLQIRSDNGPGVHQQGGGAVGLRERRGLALHRAWQANRERLH